jgi:hypothetical protein
MLIYSVNPQINVNRREFFTTEITETQEGIYF